MKRLFNFLRFRDSIEYLICAVIIGIMAVVTLGACVVIRPIGLLIEWSQRRQNL